MRWQTLKRRRGPKWALRIRRSQCRQGTKTVIPYDGNLKDTGRSQGAWVEDKSICNSFTARCNLNPEPLPDWANDPPSVELGYRGMSVRNYERYDFSNQYHPRRTAGLLEAAITKLVGHDTS